MFGKTKEKITRPARDVAVLAVLALVMALMSILFTMANMHGNR